MEAEPTRPGWRFWLLWVPASLVGPAIGAVPLLVMGLLLGLSLRHSALGVTGFGLPYALLAAFIGALVGALSGAGQWLLLRRRLPNAHLWVAATAAGWAIGRGLDVTHYGVVSVSLSPGPTELYAVVPVGLATGLTQWYVLRRHVPRAGWWVAASVVSSGLAGLAASTADDPAQVAAGIIVASALTGAVMVWLLRPRARGRWNGRPAMRFESKLVLITGSGRGLGRAMALNFAAEGADVAINFWRNRAPAEATAAEVRGMGRRALVIRADVGTEAGIAALFDAVVADFDGLDILVCNAASGYNRPALQQKFKGWDWTMNINARAALFCAQRAAPLMARRGGGYIVNVSSLGSGRVLRDYVLVGASKAALEALTRYLAVELAPMNIVVNAISPGVVQTDALRHFAERREAHPGDMLAATLAATPAGRLLTAEDVAGVVAFLCTPDAGMIRGQALVVDGGATLPLRGMLGN